MAICPSQETNFHKVDMGILGVERGVRVLQGAAQLALALGLSSKMITPLLGKGCDFAKIADRLFDARIAILSTGLLMDIGRFNYGHILGDVRDKEGAKKLSTETTFSVALLVLDAATLSCFLTTHFIPKNVVTGLLDTALKPAMITVFATMYATKHAANRGAPGEQRDVNKFALDLVAGLVPVLLPKLLGGSKWQNPVFNIATGLYGGYVIFENNFRTPKP